MQGKGVQEEQLEATVGYCINQARQFIAFLMSNDVSTTCSVCSACKRDKKKARAYLLVIVTTQASISYR